MYTIKPKFYLYCFKVFSETQNDNKYKDNKRKNDAEETYSYPEDTTKKSMMFQKFRM